MSRKRKSGAQESSKHLRLYEKSYKGGGRLDFHHAIFEALQKLTKAKKALYPGCHRHLTLALLVPEVVFADCDAKVAPLYSDPVAAAYVETNKTYSDESKHSFICANVEHDISKKLSADFDLLISLSAGLIAGLCSKFVAPGGHLFVNDSHSDARMIHMNSHDWSLIAYWDDDQGVFKSDDLHRCFQAVDKKTKNKGPMTKAQALESTKIGTIKKRSFTMPFEPMFYVFRKKSATGDA